VESEGARPERLEQFRRRLAQIHRAMMTAHACSGQGTRSHQGGNANGAASEAASGAAESGAGGVAATEGSGTDWDATDGRTAEAEDVLAAEVDELHRFGVATQSLLDGVASHLSASASSPLSEPSSGELPLVLGAALSQLEAALEREQGADAAK
jgi:hypothetical protein